MTNAVKHFKWEPRGKRRIHAKPSWSELTACRPWLEAELAVVRPRVLVCLGATAAQSLLGRQFRVTRQRGEWLDSDLAEHVTATIHPSAILRQRDDESRHQEMTKFVNDLKLVAKRTKGRRLSLGEAGLSRRLPRSRARAAGARPGGQTKTARSVRETALSRTRSSVQLRAKREALREAA